MRFGLIICVTFFVFTACKSRKIKPVEPISSDQYPSSVQQVKQPVNPPDSVDLDFNLLRVTPYKDSVVVKMKYGGGCIKPHVFVMYTSGQPNEQGVVDIYLAHKTHNDKCKAFVLTEQSFVWHHVFAPFTKVRINGNEIIEIPYE